VISNSECVCTLSTCVSTACVKRENMDWDWGQVSAAWVGVPRKVEEMSGNFTSPGEWSPC